MKMSPFALVHQHIEDIMPGIVREPQGYIQHPFLAVSHGQHYAGGVFTWDHFHMALRFACEGKPQYLRYQVDNVLAYQREDGFVPSMVFVTTDLSTSNQHAQPFLFQAAWLYAGQVNHDEWVVNVFPKLRMYLAHYEQQNRAANGLFAWRETFMSGIDNDVATCFFAPKTVIPCDLSSWLYLEYRAASKLAERIGRLPEAAEYHEKAQSLRGLINEILWCEEAGSYAAFNLATKAHLFHYKDPHLDASVGACAFQSCSNLLPLYAGVADAEQARTMIKRYLLSEDHFSSLFGIRSLSKASLYYNNAVWGNPPRFGDMTVLTTSNWQGPVWILLNYFMFHALHYYGFREEAGDLAYRTHHVLERSLKEIGSFTENFDAETGCPLYASEFASWNILADVMTERSHRDGWLLKLLHERS